MITLYQIVVVVFPKPEELKFRAEKRFQEMGKEVPLDAVNEILGILMINIPRCLAVPFLDLAIHHIYSMNLAANFTFPMSKDMHMADEYFDQVLWIRYLYTIMIKCQTP